MTEQNLPRKKRVSLLAKINNSNVNPQDQSSFLRRKRNLKLNAGKRNSLPFSQIPSNNNPRNPNNPGIEQNDVEISTKQDKNREANNKHKLNTHKEDLNETPYYPKRHSREVLFSPIIVSPVNSPLFSPLTTTAIINENLKIKETIPKSTRNSKINSSKSKSDMAGLSLRKIADSNELISNCFDQIVSRNIQTAIMSAEKEEILYFLKVCDENILKFCCDIFANYIIQKIIEVDQIFLGFITDYLKGNFTLLSKDTCGCRVIQCMISSSYSKERKLEIMKFMERKKPIYMNKMFRELSLKSFGNQGNNRIFERSFDTFIVFNSFNDYKKNSENEETKKVSNEKINEKEEIMKFDGTVILTEIYEELKPHLLNISLDINGNHVIQKILSTENLESFQHFCFEIEQNYSSFVQDLYGCRVLQKVLEMGGILLNKLLIAIEGKVPKFAWDLNNRRRLVTINGNNYSNNINNNNNNNKSSDKEQNFYSGIESLIKNSELIIEFTKGLKKQELRNTMNIISNSLDKILVHISASVKKYLIHQYANYVVQTVFKYLVLTNKINSQISNANNGVVDIDDSDESFVENYAKKFVTNVSKEIMNNFVEYANHKYASNIVETCFFCFTGDMKDQLDALLESNYILENLLRDPYGNYVVQTGIKCCKDDNRRKVIIKKAKNIIGNYCQNTSEKHVMEFLDTYTL